MARFAGGDKELHVRVSNDAAETLHSQSQGHTATSIMDPGRWKDDDEGAVWEEDLGPEIYEVDLTGDKVYA